jgi:DNA-binding LytR/AlgR family response regulator
MNKAVAAFEKNLGSHIVLKTSEGVQKINFAEFLYSETDKHIQRIYLINQSCLKVRISCGELYDLLSGDSRFYKCGSTYIMNLAKIKEVTLHNIFCENDIQIPMQRRQYKELLERYTRYALEGGL